MNLAFTAFIKLLKLLYPFIKESILGQDSVLTILRKRKVFVFVVVSNIALFFTTAFLAEQSFILLDRLKEVKAEVVTKDKEYAILRERNIHLLGLLEGDVEEICYAYLSGEYEDGVKKEPRTDNQQFEEVLTEVVEEPP